MAQKLKSGNWRQRVTYTDELGSRKVASFTADNEDEANYLAAEFKFKRKRESKTENITIGDAVNRYIESKSAVLSPSTIRTYRQIERLYVASIKSTRIASIDNVSIQMWVNSLSVSLQRKTVSNAYGLVSAALAVFRPEFKTNVTLPQKKKKEVEIPSQKEADLLIEKSTGTPLCIAVILGAYCGMRRSEIVGLDWADVNFKKNTVHVCRAAVYDEVWSQTIKNPKTYESDRVLDLPDVAMAELKQLKSQGNYKPYPYNLNSITRGFDVLCKKAGIQHYNFHLLRHFYASLLISLNVPTKYIMEFMGHNSDNMIKKVYGHIMAEKTNDVRREMRDYFCKRKA